MNVASSLFDSSGDYARAKWRWWKIATVIDVLGMIWLILFGRLAMSPEPSGWNYIWRDALLLLFAGFGPWLVVRMVLKFYCRDILQRRFNLIHATRSGPLSKYIGLFIFQLFGVVPLSVGVVLAVRYWVGAYWSLAVAAFFLGCVAIGRFWSRSPHRLFGFKIHPLPRNPETTQFYDVLDRMGAENVQLCLLETTSIGAEAYAAYISRPKPTIYLGESLCKLLTTKELCTVIAHELAHHFRRHTAGMYWYITVTWFLMLVTGWWVLHCLAPDPQAIRQELYAIPTVLLAVWLMWFFLTLFRMALSRRQERSANRWVLETIGDADAFISTMRKLAWRNLVGGRPTGWARLMSSHPSLDDVERQVECWKKEVSEKSSEE